MIQEIINLVRDLEQNNPDIHQKGVDLREGLYLFVEIREGSEISVIHRFPYYKKNKGEVILEYPQLFERCLLLQQVWQPVAPSKIFNPNAKIFGVTCSPFAIGFNKKNMDGKNEKSKDEQLKKVQDGIFQYFDTAKKYLVVEDETLQLQFSSWFNIFSEYCKNQLLEFLKTENDYQSAKEGDDFTMYLILSNPDYEHFKMIYGDYFAKNVFNKDEFNKEDAQGTIMGVPDSLYTYNGKKPFLQHQSSPFNLKYRTGREDAKAIWQFYNLQKVLLPNPLPIFIDKKELNSDVVRLYNEEKRATYTEIIKSLFEQHTKDLGGYYLLFIQKGDIIDIDFVSNFRYHLSGCELRQADCLNCNYEDKKTGGRVRWKIEGGIQNIFQFQERIANKLLGVELEAETKAGGKWLKYFGDVEYNPKYMTEIQYNLFLSYRYALYNYIYKSQEKAINSLIFHDIMVKGIIDDLRHDEWKDNKHTKQYNIKEKILIWFSLYHFFDQNKSVNLDMVNLTQQFFDDLKAYTKSDAPTMEHVDPRLFAFGAGQLIRQILQQSKSEKRSHALLEPFLQKTDVNQFKLAIARAFETYKHEFTLYGGNKRYELDRTMALIMGADDPAINVKELLPYTLAGYFSDSVFLKENTEKAVEDNDNK